MVTLAAGGVSARDLWAWGEELCSPRRPKEAEAVRDGLGKEDDPRLRSLSEVGAFASRSDCCRDEARLDLDFFFDPGCGLNRTAVKHPERDGAMRNEVLVPDGGFLHLAGLEAALQVRPLLEEDLTYVFVLGP
jgi:hypothetical protein